MTYVELISTPIHTQVTPALSKQIWREWLIDFSFLLPATGSIGQPKPTYTLQVDGQANIILVPSSKSKIIATIEQWTTAFLRFVAVYTTKHHHVTPKLMKYGEIVRDLAQRQANWVFYDTRFRMLRQSLKYIRPTALQ